MGKEKAPISSNQIDLMRWGLLFIIHIIHRSSVIWGLYNLYGFFVVVIDMIDNGLV